MATTYTLINSNVLTSSAASITFSSIPATYTDLVLRTSVKTDLAASTDYFLLRFNSDTGTNYSDTRLVAYGGTGVLSDRTSNSISNSNISLDGSVSATTNTFANTEIYLANYTSTGTKPYSAFSVVESNDANTNQILVDAAQYRGGSAISTINLAPSNGTNFVSGSSFYLYGISSN